jgi:hypothetical protein
MMIRDKELSSVSLVVTFDQNDPGFKSPTLNAQLLESAFDATLEIGQVLTERGPGMALRIPKHRLQIVLWPNSIQVTSQEDTLEAPVAERIASDLCAVTALFPQGIWRLLGYNFLYILGSTERAIEVIGKQMLAVKELSDKFGYPLLGGAVWLWMTVDNSVLWLRVEPRGSDRESNRILVSANFTDEIAGQIPSKDSIGENITKRHDILKQLLGRMGLW